MNDFKYKAILWDWDGTITNFLEAEKVAIRKCFSIFDMGECSDEMLAAYSKINVKYWEKLERGEMTKLEILVGRFVEFFEKEGLDTTKAKAFNDEYQLRLGDTIVFNDGADAMIRGLKGKILQCLITNGTKESQLHKLEESKMGPVFDMIYISDIVGHEKPTLEFFRPVLQDLSGIEPQEMLLVGDSLTSDMQGGNNIGAVTVWYNPRGEANDKGIHVDYEIKNLKELEAILQG